MLGRVQRGLESLYRIRTEVEVGNFLLRDDERVRFGPSRQPREQLLLVEDPEGLSLGLFVCDRALLNLEANDPTEGLDDRNLADFLLVVEGVSHFVYVAWRARHERTVSGLELELQAEVDKYVTCLLGVDVSLKESELLRRRLFEDFEYHADLELEERNRYRVANENARRYSASLERRYVGPQKIGAMLAELRRFYRLPLAGKLEMIHAA